MNFPIIDAVIPTYHPPKRFLSLLRMLSTQHLPVRRIHVINTDKAVFDTFLADCGMDEAALLSKYPLVDLEHIDREEFDHGGTRNRGVRKCLGMPEKAAPDHAEGAHSGNLQSEQIDPDRSDAAGYALLMTQDALPRDSFLTQNLYDAFSLDEKIAATYARQLPNKSATMTERISRQFNYPEEPGEPLIKSQQDFERLGIKTYFCSNVCAMYRLDIWRILGGFPEHMIFNEDMVYAGRALQKGFKTAYVPAACVYHSHNYTLMQQFHRNFDLGVSQADHPEIFAAAHSEGEGMRYVKNVMEALREQGAVREAPAFIVTCGCRLLGYRLGRSYKKLPDKLVMEFTGNKSYWRKQ